MGPRTVGVEEEFLLLRRDSTALAPDGEQIIGRAEALNETAQFEQELKRAQAELASDPTESLDALASDLRILRRELSTVCRQADVRLVASGTNPVRVEATTTAKPRYQDMTAAFGKVARGQLSCGMHIHVAVDSDAEAIAAVNGAARWLSLLLALSSNSPYHDSGDTDYASYRSVLWGQWPTAGAAGHFADIDSYQRLTRQLVELGASWDEGMIYFDIRRSPNYSTVEIRVCDVCADVDDAVVLAGLARAMVESAIRRRSTDDAVRIELLRAAGWRAARWGMTDELVDLSVPDHPRLRPAWDVVDGLLERLGADLDRAGDRARVTRGLDRIRALGTGAERQRAAFAEHHDFAAVLAVGTVT